MKDLKFIYFLIFMRVILTNEENGGVLSSFSDYYSSDPVVYSAVTGGAGYLIGRNNHKKVIRNLHAKVNSAKLEIFGLKPQVKSVLHDIEIKINNVRRAVDKMEQDFVQRVNQIASTVGAIDSDLPMRKSQIIATIKQASANMGKKEKTKERKIKKKIRLLKRQLRKIDNKKKMPKSEK